jgi:kynurenine formamidase
MVEEPQVELTGWIRELAESHPFGPGDRRGTVNLIDAAARSRGAALIRSGEAISLARPLRGDDYNATPERPGFAHEITYHATPDGTGWGLDHLVLDPHGLMNTHIDALNHVAVNGTFYGGRAVDDPEQGSVDVLAPAGLLTRVVHVDIPALRGTAWAESPVTGADLDAATATLDEPLQPGDALCLDMGRDRFEAATGHLLGGPETDDDAGGGLSSSGARWVAEHAISILAWDMLDSREAKATRASAHVLTWAIGLLLVDNCDFAALRGALGGGTRTAGALILAPAVVEGANGVNLNPLVFR